MHKVSQTATTARVNNKCLSHSCGKHFGDRIRAKMCPVGFQTTCFIAKAPLKKTRSRKINHPVVAVSLNFRQFWPRKHLFHRIFSFTCFIVSFRSVCSFSTPKRSKSWARLLPQHDFVENRSPTAVIITLASKLSQNGPFLGRFWPKGRHFLV